EKVLDGDDVKVRYNYTLAMNAVAMDVCADKLDELAMIEGVKSIYIDGECTLVEPAIENAVEFTGVSTINSFGNSNFGIGSTIGIIDTGLDIDHPAFAIAPRLIKYKKEDITNILASASLNAENAKSGLSADDVYKSDKIPFAFDYSDSDADVSHDGITDHGTHVAGIAAGHSEAADSALLFSGVAPYAQIVVFKVFGITEDGEEKGKTSDVVAAMEDAAMLGLDVVNMSIGWAGGLTRYTGSKEMEPVDKAIQLLKNAGVVVVCAAGNEEGAGYGNTTGTNRTTVENIDNGTVSAPSAASGVISVASINNTKRNTYKLKANINGVNTNINYNDGMYNTESFLTLVSDQAYEYEYCGYGSSSDMRGKNLNGKIALVQRGNNVTFAEKINNAQSAGAVGIIIFNNVKGDINADTENAILPTAFISREDGIKLMENTSSKQITVLDKSSYSTYENGGAVSDFTSWGVAPDLSLKPDVMAPGGNIYSSLDKDVSGREYGISSGTSMASPHVAGAVALLKVHYSETMADMTAQEFASFCMGQLISTAKPVVDQNGVYYSPRVQGAGLMSVYDAALANLIITVPGNELPKAELGDDPQKKGEYIIEFKVKNNSGVANSFVIDTKVLTETIFNKEYIAQQARDITQNVEISTGLANNTLTLDAGEEKTVKITVKLSSSIKNELRDFTNGVYIDGFVQIKSVQSRVAYTYTVPFLAFYGDWDKAPMLEDKDFTDVNENPNSWSLTTYPNSAIAVREDMEDTVFFIGQNPVWGNSAKYYTEKHNSISPNGDGYYDDMEIYLNLLRGAKTVKMTIKNAVTGETYLDTTQYGINKSLYSSSYDEIVPYSMFADSREEPWKGTDAKGNALKNGTECIVTITAALARDEYNPDDNANDTWSFPVVIDKENPEIVSAYLKSNGSKKELELTVTDNRFVSDVLLCTTDGSNSEISRTCVSEQEVSAKTQITVDVTNHYSDMYIVVTDYAWNQTVYRIGQAESIKIDQGESSVRMGDTLALTVSAYSALGYGYDENVKWSSADETIAKVDADTGIVTPVSIGDVEITAVTSDASKSDTVLIHVVAIDALITPKPGEGFAIAPNSEYEISDTYLVINTSKISVSEVLSNLLNGDLKVVDKDGNEKQDGNNAVTGDKIWITADGEVLSELIIVIKGDVTGDGALNSRDIAAIQKEIMEIEKLLGAYATA
ncbi:MAG: S8 family serine peptidase, partial [Clostridia bacterium]|nr:S8 family serine peptidase [Clostridia bacterium]